MEQRDGAEEFTELKIMVVPRGGADEGRLTTSMSPPAQDIPASTSPEREVYIMLCVSESLVCRDLRDCSSFAPSPNEQQIIATPPLYAGVHPNNSIRHLGCCWKACRFSPSPGLCDRCFSFPSRSVIVFAAGGGCGGQSTYYRRSNLASRTCCLR